MFRLLSTRVSSIPQRTSTLLLPRFLLLGIAAVIWLGLRTFSSSPLFSITSIYFSLPHTGAFSNFGCAMRYPAMPLHMLRSHSLGYLVLCASSHTGRKIALVFSFYHPRFRSTCPYPSSGNFLHGSCFYFLLSRHLYSCRLLLMPSCG